MNWLGTEVRIDKGAVLIFADTHWSAAYQGNHRNYAQTCLEIMKQISDICEEQSNSSEGLGGIIFLGDLIGVKERNITNRKFLTYVYKFYYELNELTQGQVYTVIGNHDIGNYTDVDMFTTLGLLKNVPYIDFFNPSGETEVRFHLVNYGDEHKFLELGDSSNVVLGHNEFFITGQTNWYKSKSALELSDLDNFAGTDLLVSGHIHTPSTQVMSCTMSDGSELQLYYPGNPTRVSERISDAFYVKFWYSPVSESTDFEAIPYGLKPLEEEFLDDTETLDDDTLENSKTMETVSEIIGTLNTVNTVEGNIIQQIRDRKDIEDTIKNMAIEYLTDAMSKE